MSEAMDAGTVAQPEGSPIEAGSGESSPASSQPTVDPNDFDSRLRSDPEFAARFAKEQQSRASRLEAQINKAKLAIDIAERLGNGDLTRGSEQALQELSLLRQMQANPRLAQIIQRIQAGEPIDSVAESAASSSSYGGLEEDDPREQQLRALQGTVARLQEKTALQDMVSHFDRFATGPLGKHLTPDERQEVFGAIESQFRVWSRTPAGRQQLENMNEKMIRLIALDALGDDKLEEIGRRAAQQKSEQLRSRETDGPSRLQSSAAADELPANVTALEALRIARKKFGAA